MVKRGKVLNKANTHVLYSFIFFYIYQSLCLYSQCTVRSIPFHYCPLYITSPHKSSLGPLRPLGYLHVHLFLVYYYYYLASLSFLSPHPNKSFQSTSIVKSFGLSHATFSLLQAKDPISNFHCFYCAAASIKCIFLSFLLFSQK